MITWSRVDELADEIGADDFAEVVALFLDEVEGELDRLYDLTDANALERTLHFLKGSALNLGFGEFSSMCLEGEQKSAQGEAGSVDLSAIIANFQASKSAFLTGLSEKF